MKSLIVFFLLALCPFILPAAVEAAPYYVPQGQLTASVQIDKSGVPITATFGNATGEFHFDKEMGVLSDVRVAIDARSVDSSVSEDKDAFFDMLGVTLSPEITFTAPSSVTFKDGKGSVKGTLTLNGRSGPVTLDAALGTNGELSRTFGILFTGNIKRVDFGIPGDPNNPKLYGDTITLKLDMQAIRQ